MVAQIRRVWPGLQRSTIIAIDQDDLREKECYVWMTQKDGSINASGQLIASLCLEIENNGAGLSERTVMLRVKPKTRYGYEIEAAWVPETASEARS